MKACLVNNTRKVVALWSLGNLSYKPALRVQQLLANRHFDALTAKPNEFQMLDTIVLVEHSPVYTVGIRTAGYTEAEEARLQSLQAEFYRTNRGGLITFHGPGQLVAYPVLNLANFSKSMKWYVCNLEGSVINMCKQHFQINASRSPHTGVWVGDKKICAIGVHGSRFVTTHGLALNCNVDLKWFSHVVPCGIVDKGVTSLSEALGKTVTISDAVPDFLQSFSETFNCTLLSVDTAVKLLITEQLLAEKLITEKEEAQLLRGDTWL